MENATVTTSHMKGNSFLAPILILLPLFALLFQPMHVSAAEEGHESDPSNEWVRAPEWGASWPTSPRVTIKWPVGIPGLPYRLQLKIDGQPFDSLPVQEGLGGADPYIHLLSADLMAYVGCGKVIAVGGREKCESMWRVLRLSKRSASPINLSDFDNDLSKPSFLDSYMGYPVRLSNGNSGCIVYDWSTEKYLVRWDSGSSTSEGVSVQFDREGNSVTCRQITRWERNPNYQGGEDPHRFPVYGKEYSQQLPRKK